MPNGPYDRPDYVDPLAVAARTLDELEQAKKRGFLGVLRMRWEAFVEEKLAEPMLRKMKTKERLLEGNRALFEKGRELANQAEQAQRETELHRIAYLQTQQQRQMIEGTMSAPYALPASEAAAPAPEPPLRPYLTDEQITALASRFLQQLPHGADFDEHWGRFARQYGAAVPDQILIEVRRRALNLMGGRA